MTIGSFRRGKHCFDPQRMVNSDGGARFLVIEEDKVKSKSDFHDEISRLLNLADWYGRNLDAFADVLRGGCGEVEPFDKIFVWKGHQKAKLVLGESYFNEIIEIFREANVDEDEGTVNPEEREDNLRLE